jgi:hypothetical protein
MEIGFIKDIIKLEMTYNAGNAIPSAHIKRISNIISHLSNEEKESCAIYIEKFKKLNNSVTEEIVDDAINNLENVCEYGEEIVNYMEYQNVINLMDDVSIKFKSLIIDSKKDYSLLKIKIDKLLTKAFRELMPVLLAKEITKKHNS